jgi:hypothetical protein
MAEDIERLCKRISLTEGEKKGISVHEGDTTKLQGKADRCLVGKLWSDKNTNKGAFKIVLMQIWRMVGWVDFKELQDNLWLFEFMKESDKQRVLAGWPWSFDRQILVINEFDGRIPPSQMEFKQSPFWIQVHNMPLLCMTKTVGLKIGESMGTVEDIDVTGDGAGWGWCLRMRVWVDLSIPLERGRALNYGGRSY